MCAIKYSFIIPHKNAPELLSRCVGSIPERDDLEIIVVDDNSDEDLVPAVSRPGMKIIRLNGSESKGAGHARNVGMDSSSGKWLLFADCDDFYEEGFLTVLDRYSDSDREIVLFGAHIDYVDSPYGPEEGNNWLEVSIERYQASDKSHLDLMRLLLMVSTPWCRMYNHEFVRSTGARYEEIPICNDAAFSLIVSSKAQNVEVIPDKLYYYVLNPDGITRKKRPLSHYYQEIDSQNRLNLLKKRCGVPDIICLPGFNKKRVIRDYGKLTFYKLYLYKIMHDPTYPATFLFHVRRKLKRLI